MNLPIFNCDCSSYSRDLELYSKKEHRAEFMPILNLQSIDIQFDSNFSNLSRHSFQSKNVIEIKNFKNEAIDEQIQTINKKGDFILIIGWWMNHYGHCLLDILPAFEYIRSIFKNSNFKFLIPSSSPINSILLALDSAFWTRSLETYDPKNGLSLTGNIKIYSFDQYPHRYKGGSIDLINRLKKTNLNSSQTNNEVIFCPRYTDSDSINGKHQTQYEIDKISEELSSFCKKFNLIFKIFKPKLETGGWMSANKQRQFFQNAHTVIGLRGSAMHNVIWSKKMIDKNLKPLNIIEFTQCESKLSAYNLAPNDHRLRKGDDLGSWKQYSSDFNSQYYHIFYTIKESEKHYVYIDINELSLVLRQILTK